MAESPSGRALWCSRDVISANTLLLLCSRQKKKDNSLIWERQILWLSFPRVTNSQVEMAFKSYNWIVRLWSIFILTEIDLPMLGIHKGEFFEKAQRFKMCWIIDGVFPSSVECFIKLMSDRKEWCCSINKTFFMHENIKKYQVHTAFSIVCFTHQMTFYIALLILFSIY